MNAKWVMVPAGSDPILFTDEANNMNFSTFELACEFAPDGSTITMQGDLNDNLAIPATAGGRDLIIDGGGHTLSGDISTHTDLSSLKINNFIFIFKLS